MGPLSDYHVQLKPQQHFSLSNDFNDAAFRYFRSRSPRGS